MFDSYTKRDPYNRKGLRNIDNTPRNTYNCAGYALGTFSWYCPHSIRKDGYIYWGKTLRTEQELSERTFYAVEQMLRDFKDLRLITAVDELEVDEYAIAFRISADGDFHYIKRCRNGKWQHKRGSTPTIHTMSTYEVLNTSWYNRYNGNLVLFAKKY